MGRGGPIYLSYTALVLLSRSANASTQDLWKVDIWNGPAPSPEDGPPFSAHASRDRSLLPYQIVGIVGAYIASVLILGTLLLTVGRPSRRRAQSVMAAAKPQEMIKPMVRQYDPSPVSPASHRSWYKLRGKKSATSSIRSGVSNGRSPGMDSVVSFDTGVIEADRARRQQEMERLYAAVMAQDDRKKQASTTELPVGSPPEYNGKPPRLITDAPGLRHLMGQPSPATPKSPVRAIYPPTATMPSGPMSPTSPVRAEYPGYPQPQQNPKKMRKSLRNIKISAPMVKDDNSDGARTPLSPRSYADPGIPPEPPTAGTADSDQYSPETPHTGRPWPRGPDDEDMDEIRDLPHPAPQRTTAHVYHNPAQALTDAASPRPDPTKPVATATGTGALPLREMNRQYAAQSAQQAAAFPLSPGHWPSAHATSAGPVRTQFADAARRDRLGGGGPRTGLATPYSPYMPYTPVTPVTPRLTSRAERKQRAREERAGMGAVTEEEAVRDEGELWSSGY